MATEGNQPIPGSTHGEKAERDLAAAPRAVVAAVPDLGEARTLIQDLEEHGVPPVSIGLLGAEDEDTGVPDAESGSTEKEALGQVAKSAMAGGAVGLVVGGVIGGLASLALPDVGVLLAAVAGAVFGAGVGGAAGGMSVVKYASPAWQQTYQNKEGGQLAVAVHHPDPTVLGAAEEIMHRHPVVRVTRFDDGEEGSGADQSAPG